MKLVKPSRPEVATGCAALALSGLDNFKLRSGDYLFIVIATYAHGLGNTDDRRFITWRVYELGFQDLSVAARVHLREIGVNRVYSRISLRQAGLLFFLAQRSPA